MELLPDLAKFMLQMTMLNLAGYQKALPIYAGTRTLVYRAIRATDQQSVIIKVLRNPHPNFHDLVRFRNQYIITRNLEHPTIVEPLTLERYSNGYALVMPDDGALSLLEYWQNSGSNLSEFLTIALQLAQALHYLGQQRIIHKDIKPSNILIHPETGQIQLIDFSISSLLPKEQQQLLNPNVLEGTLAYISPEQTGRMNRGIDYRTDFYSLGVTFYELLTGVLPFQNNDPVELLHCHIAKEPLAPDELLDTQGNTYPEAISQIILKLMAKNAEERYQSALGLQHDLEQCWQQWETIGEIIPFELGERDICDRFIIPEKLYGREDEVAQLLAAFDRVAAGNGEMMLVAGFSGIGKTAVVNEVHKPIVEKRGYFIKGKFDQFNRNMPFSAFVQAFRSLMEQLLGESDASLTNWKTKILRVLGESGQVIIDVIPELEHIIGSQPPVPELSGSAAQNRFNLLFGKFVGVFSSKEHPLVIFLDDLQWADSASLNLLKLLMGESESGYLLVLGAYRDNEVFPAHPLILTLDAIIQNKSIVNTITLAPLSQVGLNHLIADTLSCSLELAIPLTELVEQKTKGNPFFATQFLKGLHEDGEINFDLDGGYWQCDIARVRQLALTDDVVEFMVTRLHKLPQKTQELLKLASCIGNIFNLSTLAIVSEQSQEEVAGALWLGLKEGLILPLSETYKFFQRSESHRQDSSLDISVSYKFLHDRVQQASYSLIPGSQKQKTHLTIGRSLLQSTPEAALEEKVFDIVNHLNMGRNLIVNIQEKQQLCKLNLQAGCKAKKSTAYAASIEYLLLGIELLEANSWEDQYGLTLALYQSATESAYLNGDFQQMEQLADVALKQSRTLLDTIIIDEVKIQALQAQVLFREAIDSAMIILEKLGMRQFPQEPNSSHIDLWLEEVRKNLGERHPTDLIDLPVMSDPSICAAMRILASISGASYIADPMLFILIVFEKVNLSIKYGNSPFSDSSYAGMGLVLCGICDDIELGYQFGQLAIQLALKSNTAYSGRAIKITNAQVKHHKEHLRNTLEGLKTAYSMGLEIGDFEYVGYAALYYSFHCYLSGKELSELKKELSTYSYAVEHFRQEASKNYIDIYRQAIDNLLDLSPNPVLLVGKAYNEEKMLPVHQQANDLTALYYVNFNRGLLCYLFEDYEQASQSFDDAQKKYVKGVLGTCLVPLLYFYQSLVILAKIASQPKAEHQNMLEQITANQVKLKKCAGYAPANYLHKWYLVEAEKNRILNQKLDAIEYYDSAIVGAQNNGFIQEEALANELAAKFYLDWGKEKMASTYMQEAYYCYACWGAKAKAKQLEEKYPQLLSSILQQQRAEFITLKSLDSLTQKLTVSTQTPNRNSSSTISELLDFTSILQAAHTLSRTIELDQLLEDIVRIVITNAGAQKAVLLIPQAEQWQLLSVAQLTEDGIVETSRRSELITAEISVPIRVIQYVKNTRGPVLIDEGKTEISGILEGYLLKHQPKSVLCLPLLNQGQLVAIVYLEHPTTKAIFTPNRLTVIQFLCAQAAVSLQNAQLYDQSQQALQELKQAQLQLVQSEKMSASGNLVAGVAHEINKPTSFLQGNIQPAQDYVQDLLGLIELLLTKCPGNDPQITEEIEKIDLEFIREDFPKLLDSMEVAVKRIRSLSNSLCISLRKEQN
ncbi:MAG: AAA family ATPase [Symploca sp. SIO2C1]|nr:AAA family ATPase [Symploca sp. SIO2C1]